MQVIVGTAARLAAFVAFAALVWVIGAIDRSDFSRLALAATAGAAVGLLGGWRLPRTGYRSTGLSLRHRPPRPRRLGERAVAPAARQLAGSAGPDLQPAEENSPDSAPCHDGDSFGSDGGPGQAALAVAGFCMALFSVISLSGRQCGSPSTRRAGSRPRRLESGASPLLSTGA